MGKTKPGRLRRRDRNTGALEVYDPDANRWAALAAIPTPRDHLAVAAVDGLLYAIGGRINGNYARNLDVNEVYNPRTDRWQRLSPIPTARSGIAAAVLQGRIFVVGGEAPPALSIKSRPTTPRATVVRVTPACRHRVTGWAPRSTPDAYMSFLAATPGGSYSSANEIFTP